MASKLSTSVGGISRLFNAHLKSVGYAVGVAAVLALGISYKALYAGPGKIISSDAIETSNTSLQVNTQNSSSNNTEDPGKTGSSAISDENISESNVSSEVKVNVNGQDIPVPNSGSVQKQINTEDGNTTVEVNINNQTSGDSKSSSNKARINIRTDSDSTTRMTNQMNEEEVSR